MRPLRLDARTLVAGAVALLAAWALVETAGWPPKTALYPRVIGIPLFVLATIETILSLRGRVEPEGGEAVDFTLSAEIPPDVAARRAAIIIAWMGGFYLAIILIGFPRAIPLFAFAYLRAQAKEGWIISLLVPALAWLGFYLLFIRLLHTPFAEGLLWGLVFR